MNRMSKDQAQKFLDAAERYFELVEQHGQDDDRVIAAFTQVIVLGPQDLKNSFEKKARELGLLPEPIGYSDDDKPVFSLQDVAAAHNLPESSLRKALEEMDTARAEIGLPPMTHAPDKPIHRKQ